MRGTDGDLLTPPPDAGATSLGEELRFFATLMEDILWATLNWRADTEDFLGWTAEDWHALPREGRPMPKWGGWARYSARTAR